MAKTMEDWFLRGRPRGRGGRGGPMKDFLIELGRSVGLLGTLGAVLWVAS